MKKFLMAVFALAIAATVATAGVGINWTVAWGAYTHDAPNTTDYPSPNALLDSYSALWQLIYAGANNIADPVDDVNWAGGAGIADDYVSGDDVVWAERSIPLGGGTAPEDSTQWDNWMLPVSGFVVYQDLGWSTAGFVYQRVFEGTPAPGSWFFQSPLLALNTSYTGGGSPTQDFFLDDGNAGFQPTLQVPEPATMGLLGLGALVMAIRRRRS